MPIVGTGRVEQERLKCCNGGSSEFIAVIWSELRGPSKRKVNKRVTASEYLEEWRGESRMDLMMTYRVREEGFPGFRREGYVMIRFDAGTAHS